MSLAWDIKSFSPSEKLVLLALADCSNDDGYCCPNHSNIAMKSSLSEKDVAEILAKFAEMQILSVAKDISWDEKDWHFINCTVLEKMLKN